jgi:hypothetical protein
MDIAILKDTPPWEWPTGIGHKFLTILRDRQAKASDRLLAAGFAGDLVVMNDALAHALLTIVGNAAEAEELRAQAAVSLGPVLEEAYIDEFDDPEFVHISEKTFDKITQTLHTTFLDTGLPKFLRRRILEGSVRAPQDWHTEAIRTAYTSDDPEWKLTAVFCMNYVGEFQEQIVESLGSANPEIRYEAVTAAGNWEVEAAWPQVSALVKAKDTEKELLLAAIEAVATIRPQEAGQLLLDLVDSEDEDIVDAAHEAMSMAEGMLADDELDDHEFDDDDEDEEDDEEEEDDDEDDDDDDDDDEEEDDEEESGSGDRKTGQ